MTTYEHVFIARQDVSPQQVDALLETFKSVITEGGGNVGKTEYWGLRNMAYRIRKNRKGHYVLMNIDAPHAAVAEMERQMGIHEDILRFMTLRTEALDDKPSAMMQSREDRGPRPGGRRERGGFGENGGGPRRERSTEGGTRRLFEDDGDHGTVRLADIAGDDE
ncbi:MAG TPA: 30S ribosomal protein S6 [Alphaproteobacteria bacterium]|nr:small subunit ribosomal protein S6 [Alphaproteobacteria bacterium]HEX4890185.1 30S ribosomal protein S6 [Alphaproteobacteria bacterium]